MAVSTHGFERPLKPSVIQRNLIKIHTSSDDEESEGEEVDDDFFDAEKIKKKFMSAWTNIKYGFNVQYKPTFSDSSPIWLLGRCYHSKNFEDSSSYLDVDERFRILNLDQFFDDFSSLIWLTYRKHFTQLAGSTFTSDGGWGCMLRSGQMLLANAILVHMLRNGWRKSERITSYEKNYIYRMIIRFFNDEDSNHSPFSLHELVRFGERCGKKPGDWYGPASVAYVLNFAVRNASHTALETFQVYVAQDSTIYKEDVVEICTQCNNSDSQLSCDKIWRAVLILVPLRLGSDGLNTIYIPCLRSLLTLDSCVGIIGGRPKHSLYFVGFQDNKVIHLDPHYLQDKVDMTHRDFPVESFHCQYPRKMSFKRMDPSCTIGFYCRTELDFRKFCKDAAAVLNPPLQKTEYPMFVFCDGKAEQYHLEFADGPPGGLVQSDVEIHVSRSKASKNKRKKDRRPGEAPAVEEYVLVD